MFWHNPDINRLINVRIIEYDIKSGNTSIMRAFNLAPLEKIERIEAMQKQDRVITVGNMMRDKEFSKNLESGFNEVVKEFIQLNGLDMDDDVLCIMRDAVYVINKEIRVDTIRETCRFVQKNEYEGYFQCKPFEFYIGAKKIDVKGMADQMLEKHEGVLELIGTIYSACKEFHMDRVKVNAFLHDVVYGYLHKELPLEYYKEFTPEGQYRVLLYGKEIMSDTISEYDLPDVDISYNYMHIIIPLIKIICT